MILPWNALFSVIIFIVYFYYSLFLYWDIIGLMYREQTFVFFQKVLYMYMYISELSSVCLWSLLLQINFRFAPLTCVVFPVQCYRHSRYVVVETVLRFRKITCTCIVRLHAWWFCFFIMRCWVSLIRIYCRTSKFQWSIQHNSTSLS